MSQQFLKVGTPYPLAESGLGSMRAIWDGGAARPPKAGEWYFSGAVIEAYRAPYDSIVPYHIAQLVSVPEEQATVTRFEVIDHRHGGGGRIYSTSPCTIELSWQDNGRTLKVFVLDPKP